MATQRRAAQPAKKTAARKPATKAQANASMNKGASVRRTKAIADGYAAGTRKPPPEEAMELPEDATPLDVMVMAMRRAFMVGGSLFAAKYAEAAAPYMHGKISTVELKNAVRTQGSGDQQTGPVPFLIEFVESDGDGKPKLTQEN
jgi:hypothetical protein